jgi:hypothetical protein
MSDEFLYEWRQMPRPEFAEALKERIFREPPGSARRGPRLGLVAMLVAVILAACATPQIRTPILRATEAVIARGQVIFMTYTVGGPPRLEVTSPSGERVVVTIKTMSVAEAQERVPFSLRIPTWVPEGLKMNLLTVIPPEAYGDWIIYVGWRGPYSGGVAFPDPSLAPLFLQIEGPNVRRWWALGGEAPPTLTAFPYPEEGTEINGKPVYMTVSQQWYAPVATISWVQEEDGVRYTLTGNLSMISQEDMIRVAETIR